MVKRKPGVVYPANITPDRETGIGDWTLEEIETLLQSGVDHHGRQTLPVMPWLSYSRLLPEDATAIAMYLKSLPPVKHQAPANVQSRPAGHRTLHPFRDLSQPAVGNSTPIRSILCDERQSQGDKNPIASCEFQQRCIQPACHVSCNVSREFLHDDGNANLANYANYAN